jgi:hypothetical protein
LPLIMDRIWKLTKLLSKYKLVILIGILTAISQIIGILPNAWSWLAYPLAAAAVFIAGYMKYREVEPDLRFEDKRTFFLDHACFNAMERLREFDDTARLNIMEVGGIGPDSVKSLNIIYDAFVKDDHPDKFMEMTYMQGVCGDAVRKGKSSYADISDPERPAFGLTPEQLRKTEHVTFVISVPIKKAVTGPDGKTHLTDEIIGVVNFDSGKPDPENFYRNTMVEDEPLLKRQLEALQEISEYCSRLLS